MEIKVQIPHLASYLYWASTFRQVNFCLFPLIGHNHYAFLLLTILLCNFFFSSETHLILIFSIWRFVGGIHMYQSLGHSNNSYKTCLMIMVQHALLYSVLPPSIPPAPMLRCDITHLEESCLIQRPGGLTESKEGVPEFPIPTQCWVYVHFSLVSQWLLSDSKINMRSKRLRITVADEGMGITEPNALNQPSGGP